MTTGADIKRIVETKIFRPFSNFYNNTKLNDLMKEALYSSINDVYDGLSEQVDYDDLVSVLRTEQVFGVNNNKIFVSSIPVVSITALSGTSLSIVTSLPHNLAVGDSVEFSDVAGITTVPVINSTAFAVTITNDTTFLITVTSNTGTHTANTGGVDSIADGTYDKLVSDYGDLLAIKAKYTKTLDLTITDAKNSQPIRIKVNKRNNIKTGEKINISGVTGNSNANGTFYVKTINDFQFDLYIDKDFQNPTTGNGACGGTPKVKRPYYKIASPR